MDLFPNIRQLLESFPAKRWLDLIVTTAISGRYTRVGIQPIPKKMILHAVCANSPTQPSLTLAPLPIAHIDSLEGLLRQKIATAGGAAVPIAEGGELGGFPVSVDQTMYASIEVFFRSLSGTPTFLLRLTYIPKAPRVP